MVKALQKCPGLVLVSSDWETYRQSSQAFMAILCEYSGMVEQASVDEAYVDMTETVDMRLLKNCSRLQGEPLRAARRRAAEELSAEIRKEVRTRLGFTVNVGVSSNKLLAKMASDFKKPDFTHTLWPEEIKEKMWPLSIGRLYGCGSRTAARLSGIGIVTIGDAAATELSVLQSFLGEKGGEYISRASHGIGSTHVRIESEEAKSYSNELTTAEDVTIQNYERIARPIISRLSGKVASRLQRDGVFGSTITVSVKTNDFRRHSRQRKLGASTNEETVIRRNAEELVQSLLYEENGIFDRGAGVRLIGVGVSSLDRGEYRQLDLEGFLLQQKEEKKREAVRRKEKCLDEMMKRLQERYGADTIHKGTD